MLLAEEATGRAEEEQMRHNPTSLVDSTAASEATEDEELQSTSDLLTCLRGERERKSENDREHGDIQSVNSIFFSLHALFRRRRRRRKNERAKLSSSKTPETVEKSLRVAA